MYIKKIPRIQYLALGGRISLTEEFEIIALDDETVMFVCIKYYYGD
uniref:Uncharacterized protein n=1 Tax=viral metagenome TaxID=1070528 RepID=A0A6C0BYQ3_9ZZZZ